MIKITIEGWKDEAVVLEDVMEFTMLAETEGRRASLSKCTDSFMSLAAVQALTDYTNAQRKEG